MSQRSRRPPWAETGLTRYDNETDEVREERERLERGIAEHSGPVTVRQMTAEERQRYGVPDEPSTEGGKSPERSDRRTTERVLSLVADQGLSPAQAMRKLDVAQGTVSGILTRAVQQGHIRRVGRGEYERVRKREVAGLTEEQVRRIVTEQVQPLAKRLDVIAQELHRLGQRPAESPAEMTGTAGDLSQITFRLLDILERQGGRAS